jgi:hypothetical protein
VKSSMKFSGSCDDFWFPLVIMEDTSRECVHRRLPVQTEDRYLKCMFDNYLGIIASLLEQSILRWKQVRARTQIVPADHRSTSKKKMRSVISLENQWRYVHESSHLFRAGSGTTPTYRLTISRSRSSLDDMLYGPGTRTSTSTCL